MLKKIILNLINIVSILAIGAAVIVLLTVVLTRSGDAPNILGYSVFRVMTGSMEPTIRTDSLIVTQRVEPDQVEVGDVISFYSMDPAHGGAVNTHRVVSIEQDGDQFCYTTKGDANGLADPYLTLSEDMIGKVIFVSYPLGVLVHLLSNPLIFLPFIILPLFLILLYNLIRTIRTAKGLVKEEEEAAIREAVEEIRKQKMEERNRKSQDQDT